MWRFRGQLSASDHRHSLRSAVSRWLHLSLGGVIGVALLPARERPHPHPASSPGGTGTACASEETHDDEPGPYLRRNANEQVIGSWLRQHETCVIVSNRPLDIGDEFTIDGQGSTPNLVVRLRDAIPSSDEITAPEARAFVVSNIHGHYEALVELLRAHHVIDSELRWCHGRNWLVVFGDVVDHGPAPLAILWLLYQLEHDAKAAGGGVAFVLGEAELNLLRGVEQGMHASAHLMALRLGVNSYAQLFEVRSVLGDWLRIKPTVFRWNDTLFIHRVMASALSERRLPATAINWQLRGWLAPAPAVAGPREHLSVAGWRDAPGGVDPLPRGHGLLTGPTEEIESCLRFHGAKRVVIVDQAPVPASGYHGDRVIAMEAQPRRDPLSGRPQIEGVVIDREGVRAARANGRVERLPDRVSPTIRALNAGVRAYSR